ncbi:MAG: hypothetical protein PHO81_02085 [Candidatus Omnitrophica bacterium]|nr:hypothetical protein [Candidatus Omnitrophota bacterium]
MEIIIPEKNKNAVHPALLIKGAWSACSRNLKKLAAIYLIFNLPIAAIYLTPMASRLQNQEMTFLVFVCVFLPVLILSVWGNISLLLAASKAVCSQDYPVGQAINEAKAYFLNFLGTGLIATVFLTGIALLGAFFVGAFFPLLIKVNKILAISFCLIIAIVSIGFFVYFMIRWSLATVVCVLENTRPFNALKRSLVLIAEYVNPVVGTYFLFMLIYIACLVFFAVAGMFFGAGNYGEKPGWISAVFSLLLNVVLVPFWATLTVALYNKLKEVSESHVCS